ncbi:MAG: hypothetical protein ACLVJ6_13875 [Merdibacter sp.]
MCSILYSPSHRWRSSFVHGRSGPFIGPAEPFSILKTVRKHHVLCAVLCCSCAFAHGILAGRAPAAISGKIAAMLLLLLIVLALPLRSSANRYWRRIHRTLSVIVIVLVSVHILHAVLT